MTQQEKINVSIENRLSNLETKFELFMQESQQQREDMRRLQERQDAMHAKHDAEMHEMNAKIDANQKEFTRQLHTNFIQTMLGVGAIMAAVGGLIIATLK